MYHSNMKVLIVLLLLLIFASSASAEQFGNGKGNGEFTSGEGAGAAVPDEYVVVLDEGVDIDPTGLLKGLINSGRAEITNQYSIINGFAVRMKLNALQNALKNIAGVTIYENLVVTAIAFDHPVGSWGLDRVDQIETATDGYYSYERDGSNVDVYIIDTGIDVGHYEFGGRATYGADFTGEGDYDGHGHGTHVAGTLHRIVSLS
jgi:subtilisin family serine protease